MHRLYPFALVASICICGPVSADGLTQALPVLPGLDRLPRLAGNAPVARRVNDQLDMADDSILATALACRALPDSWWERDVSIAFSGPGFLSLDVLNDLYCDGAAHPTSFLETPTFDLATGDHVDWRQMLPADLLAPQPKRFDLALVKGSPLLVALYLRANTTSPPECRDKILASVTYFRLWLDAQEGGLVMMPEGLAHAVRACGDTVVLTATALAGIGVSPALTDALPKGVASAP